MILWRGHCSVHGRFSLEAVEQARREIPGVKVIVHPECRHEVVEAADEVGSTERIIKTIAAAPDGTKWVVGTELNLVRRLAAQFPEQQIAFLEKNVCYCSTMNRIDLPHLVWALESLVQGRVVNPIRVDPEVARRRPGGARPDARAARRDAQGLSRWRSVEADPGLGAPSAKQPSPGRWWSTRVAVVETTLVKTGAQPAPGRPRARPPDPSEHDREQATLVGIGRPSPSSSRT